MKKLSYVVTLAAVLIFVGSQFANSQTSQPCPVNKPCPTTAKPCPAPCPCQKTGKPCVSPCPCEKAGKPCPAKTKKAKMKPCPTKAKVTKATPCPCEKVSKKKHEENNEKKEMH